MALGGLAFYDKYGHPKLNERKFMTLWNVPAELQVGNIPKRIYCNRDAIPFLAQAFRSLIDRKDPSGVSYVYELKVWGGCHIFRPVRGYEKRYEELMAQKRYSLAIRLLSIHSWGGAIDVNPAENGIGMKPKLSPGFVKCFTDAGFDWGGNFKRLDGMHFQLAKL